MNPALPALSGRMSVVCSICKDTYKYTPCLPEQDGTTSHEYCDQCFPVEMTKIAADGREQIARISMHANTTTVAEPTGRLYVTAKEVAGVCEVPARDLDLKYSPRDWASPRDFKLNGDSALLFALLSLPRLADSLQSAGLPDAAQRLRAWVVPQIEAAHAASRSAAVVEKPEAQPTNRLLDWERSHDNV